LEAFAWWIAVLDERQPAAKYGDNEEVPSIEGVLRVS
jgi:hypothetical protein